MSGELKALLDTANGAIAARDRLIAAMAAERRAAVRLAFVAGALCMFSITALLAVLS